MSCRDGHMSHEVIPANPVQADMGHAAQDLRRVLASGMPVDLLAWAALHRPDVRRYLMEAWWDVEAAVDACDHEAFLAAVARCAKLVLKAKRIHASEQKQAAKVIHAPCAFHPWSGLVVLRQQQDTVIPLGRNDRAVLMISGPAVFPAPAPPQGGEQANGPDEVAA